MTPSDRRLQEEVLSACKLSPRMAMPLIPDTSCAISSSFEELMRNLADEMSPKSLTASLLQLEMGYEFGNGNTRNTAFIICTLRPVKAYPVHVSYAFLFSSILLGEYHGAGRDADALHAFISVAVFSVFDQILVNTRNVPEQARVVATRVVTVPGSWPSSTAKCAGLIAVASLLAAYLAFVTVRTVS